MSRSGSIRSLDNGRPTRVAAMCRDGAQWRLVMLERNGTIRLLDERAVAFGDAQAVRAALEANGIATLVRVAPAARVVCRMAEIPEGPEPDMMAAAGLMAEAELPGTVPEHRRAAGVVGLRASPEHRTVVMAAWIGEEDEGAIGGVEEVWTPEPVALLSLLAPGSGSRWAVAADRESGAIAIACAGSMRATLRTLREDGSDATRWAESVDAQARRTIASVGGQGPPERVELGSRRVAIDAESAGALPESLRDLANSQGRGNSRSNSLIAAGAALGFLRADSAARALFALSARAPSSERPLWARLLEWTAVPRHAAALIGVSLLLMLLAPLASALARHAILEAKSGGLERQRESEREIDLQLAFYRELEAKRWPMTKLTADLARLAPVGVSVESIRLDQGQRIGLRGRAESLELISTLQGSLNASGVFAESSVDRQQMSEARGGSGGGFDFDISARVVRPFADVQGAQDFAKQTLSERLYGARASADANGEASGGSDAEGASSTRTRGDGAGTRRSGDSRSSSRDREPAAAPEAVTDEQIQAMDRATAMKEWTRRQSASRDTRFDEATRERLKAEAEKAKARFTALKGGS